MLPLPITLFLVTIVIFFVKELFQFLRICSNRNLVVTEIVKCFV